MTFREKKRKGTDSRTLKGSDLKAKNLNGLGEAKHSGRDRK